MPVATQDNTTVAKTIAAEDLRRGDCVAVLNETFEYISFLWCCDTGLMKPDEPVRVTFKPCEPCEPLKVAEICLPFVFVKLPGGHHKTLDVRSCQLVKLDRTYAKRVRKALAKVRSRKKSSKR